MTIDVLAGQEALRQMRIDDAVSAFGRALASDPDNVPANLGLYEAFQVKGDRNTALAHQRRALERQQLYVEKLAPSGAPTVLLVAIPGDWQANVPLEFLFPNLSVGIKKIFVGEGLPLPAPSTIECDVVFNIVAQSEQSGPTLSLLEDWLPAFRRPILNRPSFVARLSRDGVARDFAGLQHLAVPSTQRVSRPALERSSLPVVVRPVGSQAGSEFAHIERPDDWEKYLAATPAAEFYVAPFVDYRAADGFYRKYRLIFVDGVPFGQHLAISDRWMVHYYNALNEREAWIRAEEERFLANVFSVFDGSRREALEEIVRRVGLDYFGIDCSVLPDGRVLIFEIDPAMIVHMGDPIEKYPYKHRYVPRIPAALEAMLRARALGRH